jgi:hypothetical protein
MLASCLTAQIITKQGTIGHNRRIGPQDVQVGGRIASINLSIDHSVGRIRASGTYFTWDLVPVGGWHSALAGAPVKWKRLPV